MPDSIVCKLCGKVQKLYFFLELNNQLKKKQICHSCNFWLEKVNWKSSFLFKPHKQVIIKGAHYYIGDQDKTTPSHCRGFGGKKFVIKFFDGTVVETVDLWYQGKIPEMFLEQLPDNAEFVD